MYKGKNQQVILNIGRDLIVINAVEGADELHRVVINSSFAGFIEKRDGEYFRLDGSEIHDLIFAKICQLVG
jgi:hypothetical protein